ncbi:flagellar hook-length control protein FliK [Parasphingorhabdus sp.]|uniref:flagellar hook-length control protein FliK n=1 Tax=Parasphingorhabdus sp. TaxID=2709688 RepID=UPI003D29FE38
MIGKIMSKASESIIGMLSAKPITMDNNASKFDFGTLLSSPEEQPQSEAGILELDVSKVENIAAGELGSAAVEHEKKAIILPMFNHNIRNAIYGREPSLNGPLDATEIAPASETPQVELTGDHDSKLTKAGLGNSDHIPASGSFHPPASGSVKNPQNRVIEDSIGLSEQPENSVAAVKRDVLLNSGSSQSAARFAVSSDARAPQSLNENPNHLLAPEISADSTSKNAEQIDLALVQRTPNNVEVRPAVDRLPIQAPIAHSNQEERTAPVEPQIFRSPAVTSELKKVVQDARFVEAGKQQSQKSAEVRIQPPVGADGIVSTNNDGLQKLQNSDIQDQRSAHSSEVRFQPLVRQEIPGARIFPSSEKGLQKLHSLQPQQLANADEATASIAEKSMPKEHEIPALRSKDQPNASDTDKRASQTTKLEIAPVVFPSILPTRSEPVAQKINILPETKQNGSRDPLGNMLKAKSVDQATIGAEKRAAESQPVDKSFQQQVALSPLDQRNIRTLQREPIADLAEQQIVTHSLTNLAVRETIQKPVPFDVTGSQVGERLGAEVTEVLATGGTKKFELNPRNLGRMEITFVARGSSEIVEIQTENEAARDVILQHSPALQDMLKAQGRGDLALRVDVKTEMFSSSNPDDANLEQQENSDAREQQSNSSRGRRDASSFDGTTDSDPGFDNNRYA